MALRVCIPAIMAYVYNDLGKYESDFLSPEQQHRVFYQDMQKCLV